MKKRGYLIAELDIKDSEIFYKEYAIRVEPVLKKFGARFLIATDRPEVIEGGREVKRVVLIDFETPEVAREFYYSREYQEIIGFRLKSAATHLYITEGLPLEVTCLSSGWGGWNCL